jgi:branched-chain amino acid transport system substrate-binding protein
VAAGTEGEEGTMKRMVTIAAVSLALVGAALGLGWAPPASAGESIKLGAVIPLTGRYGATAPQIRGGYEIAIETINRAGGVSLGGSKLPLEMVLLDDESDSTKTVARLETLAGQGVPVYLGGLGSDLHAAAAAIAEKNRTPYCGVGFALYSIHQQGYKYLFSPFWKSPDITKATFQALADTVPRTGWPS